MKHVKAEGEGVDATNSKFYKFYKDLNNYITICLILHSVLGLVSISVIFWLSNENQVGWEGGFPQTPSPNVPRWAQMDNYIIKECKPDISTSE